MRTSQSNTKCDLYLGVTSVFFVFLPRVPAVKTAFYLVKKERKVYKMTRA